MPFSSVLSISIRRLALGVLVAALCGDPGAVLAQSGVPDSVRRAALDDFHGPDRTGKDGPLAKAGLDLLLLYHQYRSGSDRVSSLRPDDESTGARRGGLQIQDGRLTIDAVAVGDVAALAADLDSLGMTDGATAGGLVSGRFPIAKIPALARLETLRGVQPARAQTRSGSSATTPARPSQPAPANRPAPSETPTPPSEAPAPEEPSATVDEPAPTPDSSSESPARPAAPEPPPSPDEAASAPAAPPSEDAPMAMGGVLALMAVVLFLEER